MNRTTLIVIGIAGIAVILAGAYFALSLGSGHPCDASHSSFTFEEHLDEGRVVVVHSGGDQTPAAQLFVSVNNQTIASWEDSGGPGTVLAGDSIVTQGVSRGDSLRVYLNRTGDAEPERQRCKNPIMAIHTVESNTETPTP